MERHIDAEAVKAACDPSGRPTRVLGLCTSCLPSSSAEMILLNLEESTTSFTVGWFFATPEPSGEIDHRLQNGLTWQLADDRGNSYHGVDYRGGGDNSPQWRRTSYFAPRLDPAVCRLTINVSSPAGEEVIDVAIDLDR